MNYYELTCLISPELSQDQLNSFQEEIINFLQEKKGILVKSETPIKKVLGYPIKKKGQAFLVTFQFQLNPEELKNLEKNLKKNSQILRYILLKKKISKATKVAKKVPRIPKKVAKKPKVELKEIEEKLKEILGE